jgi:anti-anti-sigma factor
MCEVAMQNDRTWVRLEGELDLAGVPGIDTRLKEIAEQRPRELVLDLGGLSFIDSSGLRLLATWTKTAAGAGIAFSIAPPKPQLQRIFSLTGMDQMLPFRRAEDGD